MNFEYVGSAKFFNSRRLLSACAPPIPPSNWSSSGLVWNVSWNISTVSFCCKDLSIRGVALSKKSTIPSFRSLLPTMVDSKSASVPVEVEVEVEVDVEVDVVVLLDGIPIASYWIALFTDRYQVVWAVADAYSGADWNPFSDSLIALKLISLCDLNSNTPPTSASLSVNLIFCFVDLLGRTTSSAIFSQIGNAHANFISASVSTDVVVSHLRGSIGLSSYSTVRRANAAASVAAAASSSASLCASIASSTALRSLTKLSWISCE